jgi:hypothetical protein
MSWFTSAVKTQTRREGHGARAFQGLFLLIFFDFDYFAALVVPAFGANGVGQAHLAAVGAGSQISGGQRIVRAAAVATAFGMFTLGLRGHFLLLI